MNKIQRLALSIMKTFSCSMDEAMAFALDVEKAQSEPNGRNKGKFQELAESTAGHGEIDDLSEQVRARAKAKAGIKSFRNRDEIDEIKSRIAYIGGVRL